METFSAKLAICAGNSPVPGEFPAQRPVTRSFGVFFDLRLNQRLSKQWWRCLFETLSRVLWRHRNVLVDMICGHAVNINPSIMMSSHVGHFVSHHRKPGRLSNSLFKLPTKKYANPTLTGGRSLANSHLCVKRFISWCNHGINYGESHPIPYLLSSVHENIPLTAFDATMHSYKP